MGVKSKKQSGGRSKRRGELRVGTSGYQYDDWKGDLYPEDVPKKDWFGVYAESLDTVEINNTFYNLPEVSTFDKWHEQAPPGFVYALKYSRFGTHMKKLKDPDNHVPRFIERAERLKSYLGPILVQLPPNFKANPERLDAFLGETPDRFRWTVEVRDRDWLNDEVYEILRAHGAALCIHDLIDDHPMELTADWLYLRLHGGAKHRHGYARQALSAWARRIDAWLGKGMDVYVYFNNDVGGHAVHDARDLRRFVLGE